MSCDKYADLWPVFIQNFNKSFSEIDCPVYLGVNQYNPSYPGVKVLKTGQDRDWSTSADILLKQIPEPIIFVILEDLIPITKVDPTKFEQIISAFKEMKCSHVKYWANPKATISTSIEFLQRYQSDAPYRATVCGIWDRDKFLDLLVAGESPWQFETLGSVRSINDPDYYSLDTPLFEFLNLVEKGKWNSDLNKLSLSSRNLININCRKLMTLKEKIVCKLKKFYFNIVIKLPIGMRRSIIRFIQKALVFY